ncbi:MAG TPA: hypothetical protein VFT98_09850 [Myxococcota bacterium]|nr:hypothetical protein [Myxococcota bacterium]
MVAVLAASLLSQPSIAHQDRVFELLPNGAVVGIDPKYEPVSILVAGDGGQMEVSVRIGTRRTDLPPCVARYFRLPTAQRIHLSGSWWHDFSLLPPYLQIELPQRVSELDVMDGISLLFNLQTGELIEIEKHEITGEGRGEISEVVLPGSICSPAELKSLRPVPVPRAAFGDR